MTPLPVIANVYRCALNWSSVGQHAENVIHLRLSAGNASQVMLGLNDAMSENLWAPVTSNARIDTVSITPLDGSTPTETFTTSGAPWGGGTSGSWSPATAGIVSLATSLRGRSYRGRIYMPFIADTANDDGVMASGSLAIARDAWPLFQAALTGGVEHVVASYKHATAQLVTIYTVKAGLGTVRRRQTRVSYP